ncbi:phosphotransferase enzyme family protein [Stagonosporopsis vannaccii]|nr:phosphotransferase enzyme family protein [Stagonosporopsis vannaccii]
MDSALRASMREEVQSKSDYNLTDTEDVRSYLKDHLGLRDFKIESLSGGTANYVYRVTGQGVDAGNSRVLKHAAPQLASNSAFSLPQVRMDFEAKILANKLKDEGECHCTPGESRVEKTHVQTVPLLFYEQDMKLLCIQDAGTRNLKDAYATLSNDQVQEIGTEIGRWLARLHRQTPISSVVDSSDSNNDVGVNIARYTYTNLAETLRRTGHDAELGKLINDYFGGQIKADRGSVCHGDFWPGNVLLQSSLATQGPWVLTVIDWEMVRIGCSATDVGQFAAEAFLLDRFYGNKGLHTAFIRSYLNGGVLNYHWVTRAAIHFAVHLAVWPSHSVHWANRENTQALVDLAATILEDAISDTPDLVKWRVFDGLPDLDKIARALAADRGDPMPDPETVRELQS